MKLKTVLLCIFLLPLLGQAQNGDEYFKKKEYRTAVMAYKQEAKTKPAKYLDLAKSYFALGDYESAATAIEQYSAEYSGADKTLAEGWLELLKRDDPKVKIENLGGTVNTAQDDYIPRISTDGKTLYFLAENKAGGSGAEDIWYTEKQTDGSWGTPKALYQLNTAKNEGILSISPDGNVAILFGHFPGTFGGGDLFYAVKTETGWTFPCNLGGTINSKGWESLAAIAPDGKTLIFTSTREGGQGASDLYVTQLTEKGWTKPANLGTTVNTGGSDSYPFIAADGKTLYFSSTGHGGFGGFDIFVAKRLDDSWTNWSKPQNLGKFINTLEDDVDFSTPGSGIKGFLVRTGQLDGYGASDIYSFYLPAKFRPEQTFNLYGRVSDEKDSSVEAIVHFYDMETGKEAAKATSDGKTGMYQAALPKFKKYQVVIDMQGYLYYSTIIDLSDPELYKKKESFQLKVQADKEKLMALHGKMEELNASLKELLASNSTEIQTVFDELDKTLRAYRQASEDMEMTLTEAKYRWLEEDGDILNMRRDFELRTAQIGATFELKNIFFDFGKATLRKESEAELDKLFEIMKNSKIAIELGGHSDSIGSEDANEKLSQERVNSVKQYLVSKGIATERLEAVGYGEKQPIASNSTEEGRQLNRRVEVKILKLDYQREGGEIVTEEDKKKKDKKKEEPVEEIAEKGNMLIQLQTAARNGGLPSGSSCNQKEQPVVNNNNNKYQDNKPRKSGGGSFGNFGKIEKSNYILKSFNLSLVNWAYALPGASLGAEMSFVSKRINKWAFQYYFANPDSVDWGAGLSYLGSIQMGKTPLLLHIGFDLKGFYGNNANILLPGVQKTLYGHAGLPVGVRYILPLKGFILSPELFYNASFGYNKVNFTVPGNDKLSHLRVGFNARWKLIHGGVNYNIGQAVNFLGFRAGVSF